MTAKYTKTPVKAGWSLRKLAEPETKLNVLYKMYPIKRYARISTSNKNSKILSCGIIDSIFIITSIAVFVSVICRKTE